MASLKLKGSSHYNNKGGGSNPQRLPLDSNITSSHQLLDLKGEH